jgi:hypothetical protein
MGIILTYFLVLGYSFFSPSKSLEDFRWERRVIVLYGEDAFEREYIENQEEELKERRLLLVHLKGGQIFWTNAKVDLDAKSFLAVRGKMNPSSTWVLIGLDGGVKSQGFGSPPMEKLSQLIDTMPMRQSELKKGSGK